MSEEAMREEVAQAVEVAANKAAEEEISKLAEFESAIDENARLRIFGRYAHRHRRRRRGASAASARFRADLTLGGRLGSRRRERQCVRAHQRRRGGPQRSGIQAQRRGVAVAACTVRRHAYG